MTECLWIKKRGGLFPADPWTESVLENVKEGEFVQTGQARQPRNPKFHRLMMRLLSQVVEYTYPRFASTDELVDWLKIKSGMVKEVFVVEGVVKLQFKSVSFLAMDEAEFRSLTEKWKAIITAELLPAGMDSDDLL